MKSALFLTIALSATLLACGQDDKSKRPSPPVTATETIASGAVVTINYSAPSVKGRTIGKDLEPMDGKVWRTGANEATTFEVNKDVMVEGKALAAGKYGLFSIKKGGTWTIIFNKTAAQWGAFKYAEADDVLRVDVPGAKASPVAEKFSIAIAKSGTVTLLWGDNKVDFNVK